MSIGQSDFECACVKLHSRWQRLSSSGRWHNVKIGKDFGSTWLRITCAIENEGRDQLERHEGHGATTEASIEEDDLEALPSLPASPKQPIVLYDIVHSPSYQVPVLYIAFRDMPSSLRGLPPPEQVHEMLVPNLYRQQIHAVGPMGALSMTDHPITSTPAYFIHPCRTAEAMEPVTEGPRTTPEMYLLRWIGIIGQSVGLDVPSELAQEIETVHDVG